MRSKEAMSMAQRPGDRIVRPATREQGGQPQRRRLIERAILLERRAIRLPAAIKYAGTMAVLGLVTALLIPVREAIGLLNIGLVYLVVVIAATTLAGQRAGILASVLGFALFNYFLVPPYLTFIIGDAHNILALFVFLGVSTLISWLISNAQEQARQARQRAKDVSRLYELSRAMMGTQQPADVLAAIAEKIVEVFGAQACWILLPENGQHLSVEVQFPSRASPLTRDDIAMAEWSYQHASNIERGGMSSPHFRGQQERQIAFAPLQAARRVIGVLAVAGKESGRALTMAERTVLSTFASQAAVALERLYLLEEAQQAEVLRRTDELKSALVSAVSHDLRTPLASIMASVTSLMEPEMEWDDESRREFLQAIYDEARRLNRLVGNLLDMSRIEGGALHPEKNWYAVEEVIEGAVQRLEQNLAGHSIAVQVETGLPLVEFDFSQIDQVITNLVENALKHTPKGTKIGVEVTKQEGWVQVDVTDNGPGVPREQLSHLFDRFYQAGGAASRRGTGLGLAIAKGLVEAHGGRIWASIPTGGGLKVSFTLPLAVTSQLSAFSHGARNLTADC